jgi:hypothetical protein
MNYSYTLKMSNKVFCDHLVIEGTGYKNIPTEYGFMDIDPEPREGYNERVFRIILNGKSMDLEDFLIWDLFYYSFCHGKGQNDPDKPWVSVDVWDLLYNRECAFRNQLSSFQIDQLDHFQSTMNGQIGELCDNYL